MNKVGRCAKMLPPHLRVDYRKAEKVIISFIKDTVQSANANGVVLGLSGGSDSSVATALAVKALGPRKVRAVTLPDIESSSESALIAHKVADFLGVELTAIDITPIVSSVLNQLGMSYDSSDKVVRGNIKVRARMMVLYSIANSEKRLVVGTSDRSEWLIGYFTKWGDGAADLYPIIGLFKSQVMEFGKYLNLPFEAVSRPPTPDLWPGHTAESELGVTYDVIDEVLYWLFDEGLEPEEIPEASSIPYHAVRRVLELHEKSNHKREPLRAPFRTFKELELRLSSKLDN